MVQAALAVANGRAVPADVSEAFQRLPDVMRKADALSGQVERAVVDLAEAVMLSGREGEVFDAVVTDIGEAGARFQLCAQPVVARTAAHGVEPGDCIAVRLVAADPVRRQISFTRIG